MIFMILWMVQFVIGLITDVTESVEPTLLVIFSLVFNIFFWLMLVSFAFAIIFTEIEKNLRTQSIAETIQKLVILESGEAIQTQYRLHRAEWSGYLVLTSYRLIAYKEMGIFTKSYEMVESIYLKNIAALLYVGKFKKYISVNGIKYNLENVDNAALCDVLRQAAQEAKAKSTDRQGQQQQQQQQVTVNVLPPTGSADQYIPAPIDRQERIFCIQCGAENSRIAKFCKVCGASIEGV